MKVVFSTLTLPSVRWRQQNNGKWDTRLWTDKKFWIQAEVFWQDLAGQLKGHPALIGYNILNEPIPE